MDKLLMRKDFQLFSVGNKKYVFLSRNLHILEITTPIMDTYFKMCSKEKIALPLNEQVTKNLTSVLEEMNSIPNNMEISKEAMLTLNTTHGCNMACKYCFVSTSEDRKNVMQLPVVRKSIINMIEANQEAERYIIYFFGGEPLLHKQFIKDAVQIAKEEIILKRNKKVCFLLNTNGTLIDDAILQFFKKEDFTVTVSLDGPEDINDLNRVFLDGCGSFKRIMDCVKRLKEYGVKFNLRATFNSKTVHLAEIFRFFEDMEVPYSFAFAVGAKEKKRDETNFNDEDIIRLDNELKVVMEFLLSKLANGNPIYCSDFHKKIGVLRNRSIKLHGCEAGRHSFIVDEAGTYYTCQNMLPFTETAVGDVYKGIDSNKVDKFRSKQVEDLSVCSQCWARYLCGGGCEAERYFFDCNIQRCKVTQLEWKHFISTYIKWNDMINNKLNN